MQHHTLPQTSNCQQHKPNCFQAVQFTNMKRLPTEASLLDADDG